MPQVISSIETDQVEHSKSEEKRDPYFEITALARNHFSRHAFLGDVLNVIAESFSSPYAAIYVETGSNVTHEEWSTGEKHKAFWKPRIQNFLTESLEKPSAKARLLKPKKGNAKAVMLSTPMIDSSGMVIGALALVVTPVESEDISRLLGYLESMASLTCHAAELIGDKNRHRSETGAVAGSKAFTRIGGIKNPMELAFAITNNLRNHLGCEQVSFGLLKNNRVKILSISGIDTVAKRNPGIAIMRAAMEECADMNSPVVSQPHNPNSEDHIESNHRLHNKWQAAAKGDAVASVPIALDDKPFAVLSIRKNKDQSFTREELEDARTRVEPFAPVFVLAARASRGIFRHLLDTFALASVFMFRPGRIKSKIAVLLAAIVIPWLILGKINHQLAIPTQIVPAQISHTVMPFDGLLISAGPVAGDRITKGEILCRIDDKALVEQRVSLVAEKAVLDHERDLSMAQNDPAAVQLNLARIQFIDTQLEILDNRVTQTEIRAPIDGYIINGDLRGKVGSILGKGLPLFEISPMNKMNLELHLPESDVDDFEAVKNGQFMVYARPNIRTSFEITKIRPQAEIWDGKNVFVVEASVNLPFEWMRPGMEGSARVVVGERPVWWVAFHRAIDYVRYNWLP